MKISKHFSYKEALYLPQWKRCATKKDGLDKDILSNLKLLFNKMDLIREYVSAPIIVHVAYRPVEYNKLVKGAKRSAHLEGLACDFHVDGIPCNDIAYLLITDNKLEHWNIRLEDNGVDASWLHADLREPGPGGRYFKP